METTYPLCDLSPWPWTLEDQREALRLGVTQAVIDSAEHVCELEAGHDGLCVCGCGAAR